MKIGNVMVWCSASEAREYGATHKARIFGIIPGFFDPENAMWISRSDLLNPLEDAFAFMWSAMRQLRGEEPDFMFALGKPL